MTFKSRLQKAYKWFWLWLLESKANLGLGGPPNNWQHSPDFISRQHGMSTGIKTFSLSFTNDAFDVGMWVKFIDDDNGEWAFIMAAEDFRKIAIWYLWRWIVGEWFGLRRKLFYWKLKRDLKK